MKVNKRGPEGFTMVEIMIVVVTIGLLATMAIPNYVKARAASQTNACINNLRQLDAAVQQYALDQKEAPTAGVQLSDCTPYLKYSVSCPAGGANATITSSYQVTDCQSVPTCISPGGGAANGHVLPQ